jgi:hypothetical protein
VIFCIIDVGRVSHAIPSTDKCSELDFEVKF